MEGIWLPGFAQFLVSKKITGRRKTNERMDGPLSYDVGCHFEKLNETMYFYNLSFIFKLRWNKILEYISLSNLFKYI